MNMKVLGTSAWFLLMAVIQPIIFATIAFYMFRSGGRSGTLLYASLGAGMMGVWSSTLFGSGGMIQWQRWQGTLELGRGAAAVDGSHLSAVLARELVHRRCTRSSRRSSGGGCSSASRSTSRTRGCSRSSLPATVPRSG